ncbi:DUF397 domain-containing protein [Actinomadura spongiicola]|uniref:DUF397 domain-containing protein n=1 Tax=Actinomadura spongiicola TaxID=2303421 RepID=A0A372GMD6_9ACTN|nr:DUF397 domain-containing protein [Actinomadura spongiicola]RFS86557.1 DUF397 domain-containing protein [Actinomadura spongiicola]
MELTGEIWRKASRSHEEGDACIELASINAVIVIRDSKDPNGPTLALSVSAFQHFTSALKTL